MTLCIGGICKERDEQRIILCADSRLELPEAGGDIGFKMDTIAEGFVAMIAGTFGPGLQMIKFLKKEFGATKFDSPVDFVDSLRGSLHRYRRRLVNDFMERKLSLDYAGFIDIGKEKLPRIFFENVIEEIGSVTTQCDMIVAGFVNGDPLLLQIGEDLIITEEDPFTCIGSGSSAAMVMMFKRQYRSRLRYDEALYYVYEAKRMAEVSPGVGKETHIVILRHNHSRQQGETVVITGQSGIPALEKQFERFGPQLYQPPSDAIRSAMHPGFTSEDLKYPRDPKAGQSHQPPSQE